VKATAVAKITAAQRRVIREAAKQGYDSAGAFEGAVVHLSKLRGADESVIAAYAVQYKLGFGVSYMERHDKQGFGKRTGNQPLDVKVDAIADIFALKYRPKETDESKVIKGMRSPLEQRMTRGADQSFVRVKEGAGMKVKRTRKTKAPVIVAPEPPLDLTKLTPTFADKAAANDWFVNASAALLNACDKNNSKSKGKLVSPQITSAVSDFQAAIKKALGL
jgi:hypothetical protein